MNIIHLIEKIPFIEWEILEHFGLPYMVILYLIDAYCTYRMCKSFNDPVWTSFIPFYNWIVVFRHCWNLKAFYEHLVIEICGLILPFIIEEFVHQEIWIFILSILDLIIAFLGAKHALEIGEFTLRSYGLDVKKNLWLVFFFDGVLIKTLNRKYLGNMSHHHS